MTEKEYAQKKRKASSKIRTWSTCESKVALGYRQAIVDYGRIEPSRVIAFDFHVWLDAAKPVKRRKR